MVESQLIESKVYHALENIPKSKAALTAVKTIVNSVYIVPKMQAKIDMMSGLIATDEFDYGTAYSYFYECFEGYRTMGDLQDAGKAFKFMLFTKIFVPLSIEFSSVFEDENTLTMHGIAILYRATVLQPEVVAWEDYSVGEYKLSICVIGDSRFGTVKPCVDSYNYGQMYIQFLPWPLI